jgi:DNA-directed RNA polymerase subunit RPC12/RpoP
MQSRTDRKAKLMEQMEEAVERLLDWQEAHPVFSLTEVEELVLELRWELGEEVAQILIGQLDDPGTLARLRCERCGSRLLYKGKESKSVETRVGSTTIERSRYWCPQCREGVFPPPSGVRARSGELES